MKLFSGIVEDNNDPNKVGRVKIRIPSLHGNGISGRFIGTEALDWFEPCVPFYGGYQSGSLIIPPVGSIVWCAIDNVESGSSYKIYLGGSYGVGASTDKEFGDNVAPAGELETPEESLEEYPNVAMLFKSMLGSYIRFNELGDIGLKFNISKIKIYEDHITIRVGDEDDEEDESLIEIYEDYIIVEVGDAKVRIDKDNHINVQTEESIKVSTKDHLRVECTEDGVVEIESANLIDVKSGEVIKVESGKEISIESGEVINIESGEVINIISGDSVLIKSELATVEADTVVVDSGNILLGAGAEEGVPLGNTLKEWLDGHQHDFNYSWGSSAGSSSGTTTSPTSDSPDPSSVTKTE